MAIACEQALCEKRPGSRARRRGEGKGEGGERGKGESL